MFKKINAGLATIANDTTTLISEGTKLSGDISFSGTLEILGTVEGNILSEQKDAKVRILNGGVVKGDIKSSIIEVNGVVEGSIYAVDHLALEASCKVNGNVHYTNMEMRDNNCFQNKPINFLITIIGVISGFISGGIQFIIFIQTLMKMY